VYRQSTLDPVDPSFRALFERLEFTLRRHKFNEDPRVLSKPKQRAHLEIAIRRAESRRSLAQTGPNFKVAGIY
jgi:hypothetical protein